MKSSEKWLNSVYIYGSYGKIKLGYLFLDLSLLHYIFNVVTGRHNVITKNLILYR